ncbi:MAG TPA: hypothetical protein VK590_13515 [Saprospiraceae bacterium]|nr:hypothetical protein [Saprospiraceae bacterium]
MKNLYSYQKTFAHLEIIRYIKPILNKVFFCFFLFFQYHQLYSQNYCGSIIDSLPEADTTIHPFLMDRFGNGYSENQLIVPNILAETGPGCTNAGFLRPVVYFANGTLQANVTEVACQVINDLENLINFPVYLGKNAYIYIREKDLKDFYIPPGVIGAGSQFYNPVKELCLASASPGSLENLILHGTEIPSVSGKPTFSAVIIINQDIDWNFTGTPTGGQTDLYTVIMHELFHCLGIASNISSNGGFPDGTIPYSKYDLHLKFNSNPLIIDNAPTMDESECGCKHYDTQGDKYTISSEITYDCMTKFEDIISIGSNNSNIRDYLSHFVADPCDGKSLYLMNYITPPETTIGPDENELKVLCSLGYSINWPGGAYICDPYVDPCFISTTKDIYYNISDDIKMIVYKNDLLGNDVNADDITFIAGYNGASYTITPVIGGWEIDGLINSSHYLGVGVDVYNDPNILYYIASGCEDECEYGFIYIYQYNKNPNYSGCPTSPHDLCGDELYRV